MGSETQFARPEVAPVVAQIVGWRLSEFALTSDLNRAAQITSRRRDRDLNSQDTYEKSSSAILCCDIRYRLFSSSASLGLSLPWTVLPISLRRPLLPISLPRALLPVSVSRALLSAPGLGCRRHWACRALSLLVSGLTPAAPSPFREIGRLLCGRTSSASFGSKRFVCRNRA